jgi:hypothetical protein
MIKYFKVIAKDTINEVPIRVPQSYKFTPGKEYIVREGAWLSLCRVYDDNMNGIEINRYGMSSFKISTYFDYIENSEGFVKNKKEFKSKLLNHHGYTFSIKPVPNGKHLIAMLKQRLKELPIEVEKTYSFDKVRFKFKGEDKYSVILLGTLIGDTRPSDYIYVMNHEVGRYIHQIQAYNEDDIVEGLIAYIENRTKEE